LVPLLLSVGSLAADDHTSDTLAMVKERVQAKTATLVDVREQEEWDSGHLRDARSLPLSRLRAGRIDDTLKETLPTKMIVYLHCASGRRCLAAAEILKKEGYDARPLKEGYSQLLKAGFARAAK
jgi:rhodanese-related sulfurtransferase